MKKSVFALLMVVLLGIFGYAAYRLGDYYLEKYKSEKVTRQAAQYVRPAGGSRPDRTPEGEELPPPEGVEVDFEALLALNDDVVAWLHCPDGAISYPVVQGEDNNYYLHRLLDGSWNENGTLFEDYRCAGDFSGRNHVIYGHHMNSGIMFGSLVDYKQQSYYEKNPVMYLATPGGQYRVELLAGCLIDWDDPIYQPDVSEEYLRQFMAQSTFRPDHEIPIGGPLLTLSTCSYEFQDARYVVVGALIPMP